MIPRAAQALALAGALVAAPVAGIAAPDHGLMWTEGDLPRTFPLQIETAPGRDAYLELEDARTGDGVLGAYVTGGRFFRVLVPPGTYELTVAFGTEWEDPDALFGPETERYVHPEPLVFGPAGVGRREGYIIDLGAAATGIEARVAPFGLCQRSALDFDGFGGALPEEAARPDPRTADAVLDPLEDGPYIRRAFRRDLQERPCA